MPAAGTEATYRTVITTDTRGQQTTLGLVYRSDHSNPLVGELVALAGDSRG